VTETFARVDSDVILGAYLKLSERNLKGQIEQARALNVAKVK